MKTKSSGRSLHLFVLVLCGLTFDALLIVLVLLLGGLVIKHVHAATPAESGSTTSARLGPADQDATPTPKSVSIGAGFSGAWYDPAQSGHGIFIEVLPENRLLAWWFSFDPAGAQQAWFGGVGTYTGDTATITEVVQTTGGRWIPNFDRTRVVNRAWGALTFTFTDCSHGRVDFNSVLGFGSGSMNLTRLTTPAGLSCQ